MYIKPRYIARMVKLLFLGISRILGPHSGILLIHISIDQDRIEMALLKLYQTEPGSQGFADSLTTDSSDFVRITHYGLV